MVRQSKWKDAMQFEKQYSQKMKLLVLAERQFSTPQNAKTDTKIARQQKRYSNDRMAWTVVERTVTNLASSEVRARRDDMAEGATSV